MRFELTRGDPNGLAINRLNHSATSSGNLDSNKTAGEEARRHCEQSWTSPGGNTPQDTNCTATCLPSRKLFKLDEPDMQDTTGEAGTNS